MNKWREKQETADCYVETVLLVYSHTPSLENSLESSKGSDGFYGMSGAVNV